MRTWKELSLQEQICPWGERAGFRPMPKEKAAMRKDSCREFDVPAQRIQGKDISSAYFADAVAGSYLLMSLEQVFTILSTGIASSLRWSPLSTAE
jgi:hypothetical protein